MEQIITFLISFTIGQLLFLAVRQKKKIKELELEKERIKSSNNVSETMLKNQISLLQAQVRSLLKMKITQNTNLPTNTIQAVKYAMKHAHPDNGGNAEDFMKFQKCYEELMRK